LTSCVTISLSRRNLLRGVSQYVVSVLQRLVLYPFASTYWRCSWFGFDNHSWRLTLHIQMPNAVFMYPITVCVSIRRWEVGDADRRSISVQTSCEDLKYQRRNWNEQWVELKHMKRATGNKLMYETSSKMGFLICYGSLMDVYCRWKKKMRYLKCEWFVISHFSVICRPATTLIALCIKPFPGNDLRKIICDGISSLRIAY
jgi:hypothetical protein